MLRRFSPYRKSFSGRSPLVLNDSNSTSGASKQLSQFLLVLAGGLVGVLGNQFFFERNKKSEAEIQLKREFLKEQLPIYTRIINFAYYYRKGGIQVIDKKKITSTHYDPFGVIYDKDSTIKRDTIFYSYPSFVEDTSDRKLLYNDLAILQQNKDKIDRDIWGHIVNILIFLESHPLPVNVTMSEILKSDWGNNSTTSDWLNLLTQLYNAANDKLPSPYEDE